MPDVKNWRDYLPSADASDSRLKLAMLRARYDDGAVSPAIYSVIRKLETDIAWGEHRQMWERDT